MYDITKHRDITKYIVYPSKNKICNCDLFPPDATKLPIVRNSMYKTYALNEHHFKPFYHIDYVLPTIEKLLHFGYNVNDFKLVERRHEGYDVSYLAPNKRRRFDVYDLTDDTFFRNMSFDFIRNGKNRDESLTQYHNLYAFPHKCSRIINNGVHNGRTLVISGDSQMIPIIPVLACYFKEVWYLDNRDGVSHTQGLDELDVTDILIAGGYEEENKYLETNLL